MRTVVVGPVPDELAALIERRRAAGADLYDEVWEGEYHMVPAPGGPHAVLDNELAVLLHPFAQAAGLVGSGPFNLGRPDDYRVPDRGLHRSPPSGTWVATAALAVEIVSPGDETWDKLPFYAAHGVDEVLVADPQERRLTWLALSETGSYEQVAASALLGLDVAEVAGQIDWPPLDAE